MSSQSSELIANIYYAMKQLQRKKCWLSSIIFIIVYFTNLRSNLCTLNIRKRPSFLHEIKRFCRFFSCTFVESMGPPYWNYFFISLSYDIVKPFFFCWWDVNQSIQSIIIIWNLKILKSITLQWNLNMMKQHISHCTVL